MSLNGTYICQEINSTLEITNANDQNGTASGFISIADSTIKIQINYHFRNGDGPLTEIRFSGAIDDVNRYIGGAGRTKRHDYLTIRIAGGYSFVGKDVNTFNGTYIRNRE